jgi:hypothetical protein
MMFGILVVPNLQLHCGNEACGGMRYFSRATNDTIVLRAQHEDIFLKYVCRNCSRAYKVFALCVNSDASVSGGKAWKYGEMPIFGPPTPARLISLIGPDRDGFLKGRQAENLGLGVGAFAYYRRVVENQKDRLLDEIIRVAQRTNAKAEVIQTLSAAKKETQFSKAVDMVKDAIPESLLISGQNPLTLLHKALSEGLHNKSDEDCLTLATSIRVVLQELSERSAAALKDHAELKSALSRLLRRE